MWTALIAAAALHSCAAVSGDQVLMRDLARMDMRFSAADPNQELGYAPVPGAKRVMRAAELMRIANRNGILSGGLYYPVCFERPTRVLTSSDVERAIRAWAPAEAQIEVLELSRFPAPVGELAIPRPSAAPPSADGVVLLHGFVPFGKEQRFPVWARVRLFIRQKIVVVAADVDAGTEIHREQVRVEERENGIDSRQFASSLDQVVGQYARRRLASGSSVLLTSLEEARAVMRGAVVKVDVIDGGARLAFEGRAEESGRTGDTVKVRNPSSGKDFVARVTGMNRVLVTPADANTP
jgi:flagella basal body P-ring formation protein FlgA